MKKRFLAYFGAAAVSFLIYLQMHSFQNDVFGVLLFLFSFLVLGKMWKKTFTSLFPKREKRIFSPLSYFTPFMIVGLIAGIFITWYKADAVLLALSFFLTGVFTIEVFLRKKGNMEDDILDISKIEFPSLPPAGMLPVFYFLLWSLTLVGILTPSGAILQTPWQYLPTFFLVLFFLLTLLLGYILITSQRTTLILFLLVLHSVLLHFSLPLSHQLPWGGDVWRMIGVEGKFIAEEPLLPVLFGKEALWRDIGPVSLPEALVIPNKYIYSHLWGQTVFLARLLPIDLISLNRFLVPLTWSIFVPILLYALGRKLFRSEKQALAFSFLVLLPFPLQALGSLTLAVSWGFIFFLFLLFLWFEYLDTKNKSIAKLALLLGGLSIFGYTVFFILFWMLVLATFLLQALHKSKWQNTVWLGMSAMGIFLFPVIEMIAKMDRIPASFSLGANMKQLLGQFSGWYYASAIRPHDIISGNIIFNHTPSFSFVENIFTIQRWHIMFLMLCCFIFLSIGLFSVWKEKNISWKLMSFLFFITAGGYVIGWYVLEGERFFVRRLDPIFALLLMLFVSQGIFVWAKKYLKNSKEKIVAVLALLFFSFTFCTVYAGGPDMRVVSIDEYETAAFLSSQKASCVLADTWLLLALEGISQAQVVGGGLPIDERFGQEERVKLYAELLENPQKELVSRLANLTSRDECFLAIPKNSKNLAKIREVFGSYQYQNHSFEVWKLGLKNSLK